MASMVPINFGRPGCPAMVRTNVGQWGSCPGEPAFAGYVGSPPIRVFPCALHVELVRDAAPMTDEDRAELAGRVVQSMRGLAGLRYDRVGPAEDA